MGGVRIMLSGDFRQIILSSQKEPEQMRFKPAWNVLICGAMLKLWVFLLTRELIFSLTNYLNNFPKFCCNLETAKFHSIVMVSFLCLQSALCCFVKSVEEMVAKVFPNPQQHFHNYKWLWIVKELDLLLKISPLIQSLADCRDCEILLKLFITWLNFWTPWSPH